MRLLPLTLVAAAFLAPAAHAVDCSTVMPPRQVDALRQQVVSALPPEAQAALGQAVQTVCG